MFHYLFSKNFINRALFYFLGLIFMIPVMGKTGMHYIYCPDHIISTKYAIFKDAQLEWDKSHFSVLAGGNFYLSKGKYLLSYVFGAAHPSSSSWVPANRCLYYHHTTPEDRKELNALQLKEGKSHPHEYRLLQIQIANVPHSLIPVFKLGQEGWGWFKRKSRDGLSYFGYECGIVGEVINPKKCPFEYKNFSLK